MRLPRWSVSAKTGSALHGGGQAMIVRPLLPSQRISNAISPTSQAFAPPTACAKTHAHQVYRTPISTLSTLCCTPKRDDDGPTKIPKSTTVCTRLKPIAATARRTQSQPGAPTGCRILPIRLPPFAIRVGEPAQRSLHALGDPEDPRHTHHDVGRSSLLVGKEADGAVGTYREVKRQIERLVD